MQEHRKLSGIARCFFRWSALIVEDGSMEVQWRFNGKRSSTTACNCSLTRSFDEVFAYCSCASHIVEYRLGVLAAYSVTVDIIECPAVQYTSSKQIRIFVQFYNLQDSDGDLHFSSSWNASAQNGRRTDCVAWQCAFLLEVKRFGLLATLKTTV